MPLIKSSSKAARAVNVRRLIDEGYPPRQAVAIAYSTQRAAKAKNKAGETLSTGPAYYEAARKKAVAWVSKNRPGLTGPAWYAAVRDAYHAILDRGGSNMAGGKRRNRAGVDVDTLARIARHARSVMREQFDGWVSFGKLRDPIGHAQVIRWLMERQADRTDAGYKRNAERFGEREAAFRKGMADEAHDLISEITIKLDPVYVASLKKSNKAGGKRRGARR